MKFRGWQKTSLIEYPGKISTVLFTGSCNFRCPFCYNRELVLHPRKLPSIGEPEVMGYLRENRHLYHAVMVTGGEPTLHKGLPLFLAKVSKLGLLAGLETNGTDPVMLNKLIKGKLVDFVAMDIKAPLVWERYRRAAGISDRKLFEKVKRSVRMLLGSGLDHEFRTTVVPGIHTEEDIIKISNEIKGARRYVLQQFLPKNTIDESMSGLVPIGSRELHAMRKRAKKNVAACEVRNLS
jgi:pyruvate formate lyase activating enzyme